MGANAQTTVPTFTAAQVLTADQMNQSARTGVPVFADTTARDAAFGGSGEKTLAEGQLCYLESTDVVQYYTGSTWATVGPATAGALVFISSTTIGTTVSSVTVSNAFSATYDNYMVTANFQTISSAGTLIGLQLGSTTTGYYGSAINVPVNTGTPGGVANNNSASFLAFSIGETNRCTFTAFINQPNLARQTQVTCLGSDAGRIAYSGSEVSTTQHTAFTLTPAAGTFTGGTIRVYGIANS